MILQAESQMQLHQLIKFGEKELRKYDANSEILKKVNLKDRIIELMNIYYAKGDDLADRLKDGKMDIKEFQLELIQYLTDLYTFVTIDTKAPVGFYIDELQFELPYIIRFGFDIQNNRIGLDDRLNYRVSLYVHSTWVLYQKVEQYWAKQTGMRKERIVCPEDECSEYQTDWTQIGVNKRINDKYVGKKCWCEYQFESG